MLVQIKHHCPHWTLRFFLWPEVNSTFLLVDFPHWTRVLECLFFRFAIGQTSMFLISQPMQVRSESSKSCSCCAPSCCCFSSSDAPSPPRPAISSSEESPISVASDPT